MKHTRKQLGDEIELSVRCTDSNGTATAPTAAPVLTVYDSAGTLVLTRSLPPQAKGKTTGRFLLNLFLGSSFAAGSYFANYDYAISGTDYALEESFDIVAGGNSAGQYIALHFVEQGDQKDWLIGQTESGSLPLNRGLRV